MTSQPRIYADHAASSPLRPEAAEAMREAESALNPAGQYRTGRDARRLLEESREQIAELLGADPVEVIFTASGTEADNIAVQGLAFGSRKLHPTAGDIIAPGIEHPAVGESIDWLCTGPLDLGYRRVELPVDEHGVVDLEAAEEIGVLKNMAPEQTALITCMWANNETGNIQPVGELATIAADKGVPMHVDAVQAVGRVPIDFHGLGVATLAASAHKFGGPRSTGVLLARRDAKILSPLKGGNQERGLRSGTVNVHGAVGTAAALAAAQRDMAAENERLQGIRDRVLGAVSGIEGARVWTHDPSLPSHLHLSIPGAEGDSLIMLLDAAGVDASTGSACAAGVNRASHVLAAMGVDVEVARGALRLTFGAETTLADAERIAELLPRVAEQARAAGMA